jgi:hypothetical protein
MMCDIRESYKYAMMEVKVKMKNFYQKLVTTQHNDDAYWHSLFRLTTANLEHLAKVKPAPSWNDWW